VPGALWNRARLEELRWPLYKALPALARIVVAIDPAATSGDDAHETGIILAGKDSRTAVNATLRSIMRSVCSTISPPLFTSATTRSALCSR
jgi:phage terminase large subunit-like protein